MTKLIIKKRNLLFLIMNTTKKLYFGSYKLLKYMLNFLDFLLDAQLNSL